MAASIKRKITSARREDGEPRHASTINARRKGSIRIGDNFFGIILNSSFTKLQKALDASGVRGPLSCL
jgi:hypothetical protein